MNLDAGAVHRLDHRLELLHLLAEPAGGVVGVRCQEGQGVVAPVVAQPLVEQGGVLDELVDRHQLDGGHPQLGEVAGHGGVAEPGVRAAQVLGDVGVQLGHALDVRLVDDALVVGDLWRPVALPVEEGVDHDAERHVGRGVVVVARVLVAEGVAEEALVPVDLAGRRLRVGVEQKLGGVAAQPLGRVPGAVDAVAVALTGLHGRQVAVPDQGVDLGHLDPGLRAVLVEEAQLDPLGDLAEEREVGPAPVERRAQGVGAPRPDLHAHPCSPCFLDATTVAPLCHHCPAAFCAGI